MAATPPPASAGERRRAAARWLTENTANTTPISTVTTGKLFFPVAAMPPGTTPATTASGVTAAMTRAVTAPSDSFDAASAELSRDTGTREVVGMAAPGTVRSGGKAA